ncbi:uncharacterized protein PADG_12105 [Paracoccidioides brasiliensis Pb18]|uniref:Mitochondrial import receptor subunit tom-70 n=1 Tax=Paracoccidioides brasiliensis (strain Pb18) TaxID=502780 RepID=A0A0A0HWM5_PARBD|nr:uncharacterized protein PADG_12105 [Paracoccidioides brasiliensis Pb18]KGM91790.1 hypothetical protein PADG_12105 [Paracoccidioides brasiliensis Pb18]
MSTNKVVPPAHVIPANAAAAALNRSSLPAESSPTVWDRISTWASENKALLYTIAGVSVVVTSAGVVYYLTSDSGRSTGSTQPTEKKKSKKERRREKKKAEEEKKAEVTPPSNATQKKPEEALEIPEFDESTIDSLSAEVRASYAAKLKAAGNRAFGSLDYNRAIELYGKAILCKPDPVYYSNRAACYNALSEWDKVVEDTSAALSMDDEYVKAMNRRANAYEKLGKFSEALLDYTASCIIDGFAKESSKQAVERLLKKVAEQKGHAILEAKGKKLPSATFVSNYLQSFRLRPLPDGLGEDVELDEESSKGQLRKGLLAMSKPTSDGYEEAARAFEKALELGDLGEFEALALNMRATFTYLAGDAQAALQDLNKSVELSPSLVQSYIKRASLHLELGNREAAADDFDLAVAQNKDDPDIYYHRAQLHFILVDPECDIAVATLAQLLLQQGKVSQALKYFERAGELARTEAEVINAVSYAEATRAQLEVQERYPKLAARLQQVAGAAAMGVPPS